MQKHGYELMQADTHLWFVAKEDDAAPIPVSIEELEQLMATPDAKTFAKLLAVFRLCPLSGNAAQEAGL